MGKGNLYTHILRRENPEIKILSRLKLLWNSTPRDYKEIQQLQKELKHLRSKKKPTRKKLIGIFN